MLDIDSLDWRGTGAMMDLNSTNAPARDCSDWWRSEVLDWNCSPSAKATTDERNEDCTVEVGDTDVCSGGEIRV